MAVPLLDVGADEVLGRIGAGVETKRAQMAPHCDCRSGHVGEMRLTQANRQGECLHCGYHTVLLPACSGGGDEGGGGRNTRARRIRVVDPETGSLRGIYPSARLAAKALGFSTMAVLAAARAGRNLGDAKLLLDIEGAS